MRHTRTEIRFYDQLFTRRIDRQFIGRPKYLDGCQIVVRHYPPSPVLEIYITNGVCAVIALTFDGSHAHPMPNSTLLTARMVAGLEHVLDALVLRMARRHRLLSLLTKRGVA